MTRYLTTAEVIVIHDEIIARTGSAPKGLRDEALLESALMRATAAAYYEEADLVRQSVLIAIGICQNHPFVDGNKRAAFGVLDVFLRINGFVFTGEPIDLARHFEQIAEATDDRGAAVATMETWLRNWIEPLDSVSD